MLRQLRQALVGGGERSGSIVERLRPIGCWVAIGIEMEGDQALNGTSNGANGPDGPGGFGGPGGDQVNAALVRYLEAHQGSATYLVATASAQSASSLIIATGRPVMALGGFSGNDAILTASQLAKMVAAGKIHYFLAGGMGGMGGGQGGNSALMQWVQAHGTVVPAGQYSGASTTATGGFGRDSTLYYVSSAAAK